MCFGASYNLNINVNGSPVFMGSRISPWGGGCGCGDFLPGCFGWGFGGRMPNPFLFGMGAGIGMGAGLMLGCAMPSILKGIGNGCTWLWNKAIVPGAEAVWGGLKSAFNWTKDKISGLFHKKK